MSHHSSRSNRDSPQLLIISAHADDHVMPAGTLFKLKQQGYAINEALLTDSSQGRDWRHNTQVDGLIGLRQQEFLAASSLLGTHQIFEFHQPDLKLQSSPHLVWDLVGIIRQLQPTYIFLHHWHDWHPDHMVAHRVGLEAAKLAASGIQPELGSAWSTPYVMAAEGAFTIKPDILIDVTDHAQAKLQLWQTYASQNTPQETDFITSLMNVRGYQLRQAGQRQAEAFNILSDTPLQLF